MTNTQHAELMAELRAIRVLLARPLYDAPAAVNELCNAIVEAHPSPPAPPASAPGAQRKRDARRGK